MLALPVRARCDRPNGTMHEVYRCLLGIRLASRMLKTRCRRPTHYPALRRRPDTPCQNIILTALPDYPVRPL